MPNRSAPFLLSLLLAAPACSPAPAPLHPPALATTASARPVTSATASAESAAPKPPLAKREPHPTTLHGVTLRDDYFWLRNKGTPEVERYLAEENAYTDAQAKPFEPLAQALYDEMLARVKQDDSSPPVKDGAFRYYRRFETGKQYPIYCRVRAGKTDGPEEIILDVNALLAQMPSQKFIGVQRLRVSDDGNLLAYLVDNTGFRQNTLMVKDLRTGKTLADKAERVDGVELAKDNKTLFYVTEDAQTKRSNKLFRHTLGDDASKDALVYEEKDEMFGVFVARTLSKDFIEAITASHTTSEVRLIDAARPTAAARLVAPREQDHEYYVEHRGDLLYIRTNSGGRNFRLVTAKATDPRRETWKEIVAQREDVMLENAIPFRDHLILAERKDATPRLSVYNYKTGAIEAIPQPEEAYDAEPDENREQNTTRVRFTYQSLKSPASVVEYDVKTKERRVLKETPVLHYDASAYETRRIAAPARDGTPIPVSLVYKKGLTPDGTHPLYLYAYGSYGIPTTTFFSSARVSLLDRGFVFAIAHIRGGGDNGKRWHDQGRMKSKMNTFTDFIDAAEALKKQGFAKPDAIVATGGSAGGLLMGAVANMRPDLFRVIVAHVPFVDIINTMLDESLPLTVGEFEEWGNPKKKDDFEVMVKYSPYDNVEAKPYPTMLVRSSYNDSQVMYWEPSKWVARLRATKTDTKALLFKINMNPAGHGGQSGRFDRIRDTAWDYAFVLSQLGMN